MKVIEVDDLCAEASISLSGKVDWGEAVPHVASGIYLIVAPKAGRNQNIVYIGRGKQLRKRLGQFYRHKYGNTAPHRGGQEILLLPGPKTVYWAAVEDYADAEDRLLTAFEKMAGEKPFGNCIKSARIKQE